MDQVAHVEMLKRKQQVKLSSLFPKILLSYFASNCLYTRKFVGMGLSFLVATCSAIYQIRYFLLGETGLYLMPGTYGGHEHKTMERLKQAGTGPSRRHIQGSKIAKRLPSVKYSLLQYSKIENFLKKNFRKNYILKKWTEWRANVSQCRKTERGTL